MKHLGLKLGAAAAVLALGTVGLAYAGNDLELPDQAADQAAESALADHGNSGDHDGGRKAGSSEPADGSSTSEDVHEVIEDRDGGGCEFGQAAAEAARGDNAAEDAGAEDPCSASDDRKAGSSEPADDHKAARTDVPSGSRDTGEEHAANGGRKAGSSEPTDDETPGGDRGKSGDAPAGDRGKSGK